MDRPILFSAPEVRAVLSGRKTQTRRVLRPQPEACENKYCTRLRFFDRRGRFRGDASPNLLSDGECPAAILTPFAPGDRLWVRETITRFDKGTCDQWVWYRAGGNADASASWRWIKNKHPELTGDEHLWPHPEGPAGGAPYTVPSIHMPRWASRLTLTVTDVRVQRLREISEEDAHAEGVTHAEHGGVFAREGFSKLWDSRAKPGFRWADDPWVAAVSFTTERRNIDDGEAADG